MSDRFCNLLDGDVRLECVKLANGDTEIAAAIYAFVTGQSDRTPLQRAKEALDELERTNVR